MDADTISTLAALLAGGSGIGSAWFWYDKRRLDKRIDHLDTKLDHVSDKQLEHSNKFITEPEARKLLQETVSKIEQAWAETNSDVKEIRTLLSELNTELRIINAVQSVVKEYEDKR